ncbi:hypothetical protein [Haloferula rosea]|uniref:O-antigen ligase domain-containing protein n=1 Tax=Haloferula rosea TaxID=490093 RepID=A0A934RGA2_9BACT|nr:hypothetical protein [Haloferula rosea]MBK1827805.1 hypothetical protein [Haloferula rosea]
MDSTKIRVFFVVFLAACFALYLGVAAATAQTEAIAWMVGGLAVVFVLALGKHVWLLIPAGVSLNGGLNFLPGSPAPWWIAMMITGGIFFLRLATRRTGEFTWRWSILDLVIFIHIVVLAQAYMRNPAGFSILGGAGGTVGGKPYFTHGAAIVCYVLLSMVKTDIRMFRTAMIVMIACACFDGFTVLLGTFVPAIAAVGIQFYSGFSFTAANTGAGADVAEGRTTEGKNAGRSLGRAVLTIWRPLSVLNPFNFLPFSLFMVAMAAIAISGYRSAMGLLAVYFIVCSLIRRKVADVVVCSAIAVLGICMLLFIGTERLPNSFNRILSVIPIPGLVDEKIKQGAEKSTDWRVEMWMLALTTDRYIFNKWLGDGFGIRKDEMDAMIDSAYGDNRRAFGLDMQEVLMRRGSYHGFHVQTIRSSGYIGLFLALVVLGVFFRHAWKHIQFFRGRPEWGFVLYACVPFLIYPFYAMLVFGDYRFEFPRYIIAAGFLKMLWNIRAQEALLPSATQPSAEDESGTVRRAGPGNRLPAPAMSRR